MAHLGVWWLCDLNIQKACGGGLSRPAVPFHCLCPLINSSNSFLWTTEAKVHLISLFFRITHSPLWSLWITAPHRLLSPHLPLYDSLYEQEECHCPACWSHFISGCHIPHLSPHSGFQEPHLGSCECAFLIFAYTISPHASNNCFKAGEIAWITL